MGNRKSKPTNIVINGGSSWKNVLVIPEGTTLTLIQKDKTDVIVTINYETNYHFTKKKEKFFHTFLTTCTSISITARDGNFVGKLQLNLPYIPS